MGTDILEAASLGASAPDLLSLLGERGRSSPIGTLAARALAESRSDRIFLLIWLNRV